MHLETQQFQHNALQHQQQSSYSQHVVPESAFQCQEIQLNSQASEVSKLVLYAVHAYEFLKFMEHYSSINAEES